MERSYCKNCKGNTINSSDNCAVCHKYICENCEDFKHTLKGVIYTGIEETYICGYCAMKCVKICMEKNQIHHPYTADGIKYLFNKIEE